jgi:surfactin synthase thioesterase subunit
VEIALSWRQHNSLLPFNSGSNKITIHSGTSKRTRKSDSISPLASDGHCMRGFGTFEQVRRLSRKARGQQEQLAVVNPSQPGLDFG